MSHKLSTVAIRAGHLGGVAFWDAELQTYSVDLSVFEPGRSYPPPVVRYGGRHAELVTVDALSNQLVAAGLGLDCPSLDALHDLARTVDGVWGHSEIIGLARGREAGRLFLRSPNRTVVEIHPIIDHPQYGFQWGPGASADCAAHAIARRAFGPAAPEDLATLALTLEVEYLDAVTGDFSLNTSSLCDWYLADAPLVTTVDDTERRLLRRRLEADPYGRLPSRSISTGA